MTDPATPSERAGHPEHPETSFPESLVPEVLSRLHQLAHTMLSPHDRLRRMVDSDDLVQETVLRLRQAFNGRQLESPEDFWRLANTLTYRALADLARNLYGPLGYCANTINVTDSRSGDGRLRRAADDHPSPSSEAGAGEVWQMFFQAVDQLPEKERDVFDLLWLERLEQQQAAERLGVSQRTIRTYWNRARQKLGRYLQECGLAE